MLFRSPYVGTYYSMQYVRKNVLKLTDEEIANIKTQNQEEPPAVMPGAPGSEQAAALSGEINQ